MKTKLLLFAFFSTVNLGWAQTTWVMDKAHTNIEFNVTHLVISEVSGSFGEFDGQVVANNEDFSNSEISFTAKIASINTDNEQRDNHLKSDDFFNAEKYPDLVFKGNLVKSGDNYMLNGDFTIRDITKPVSFDVKYNGTVVDPWGNTKSGFKIVGKINRFDYNLKWNALMEAGGAVVSEEIEIVVNAELQKQA